jgi:hypothetical protein
MYWRNEGIIVIISGQAVFRKKGACVTEGHAVSFVCFRIIDKGAFF